MTSGQSAIRCWICASTDIIPWKSGYSQPLVMADLKITDAHYGRTLPLVQCRRCAFIFADDRQLENLTAIYETLEDEEYSATQDTRRLQMRLLFDAALRRHPTARSILDIGAGTGLLVAEAHGRGLDATGVEPSRALVRTAKLSNKVDLLQGTIPHPGIESRRFDLVFLVDVIEHVCNPMQLLSECGRLLNPGGMLVLVTPDISSRTARVLGKRWWHLRLAHVGYFGRESLLAAVNSTGSLSFIHVERAKWFFRVRYLADRVAEFIPVRWLNRLALRIPVVRRLYDCIVPINLHDSFVVFLGLK